MKVYEGVWIISDEIPSPSPSPSRSLSSLVLLSLPLPIPLLTPPYANVNWMRSSVTKRSCHQVLKFAKLHYVSLLRLPLEADVQPKLIQTHFGNLNASQNNLIKDTIITWWLIEFKTTNRLIIRGPEGSPKCVGCKGYLHVSPLSDTPSEINGYHQKYEFGNTFKSSFQL